MDREGLSSGDQLAALGIERDLGYPAGALLFVVIDAIDNFKNKTGRRFLVLKSEYFAGTDLTDEQLDNLYELGRCALAHNALLGRVLWLRGEDRDMPFEFAADGTIQIYLPTLLGRRRSAVDLFLAEGPEVILESNAVKVLRKKADAYSQQVERAKFDPTGFGKSAQASGISGDPEQD